MLTLLLFCFFPVDLDCGDMPLLTPGSKEMMSQALKATFSGFTKEQQRLGIPKGKKLVMSVMNTVSVCRAV